ncbi:uncharacterized protein LOC123465983 [Bubalus bubalis]|uniref:uncharacterized protein LOC123465983 n=1 Tax=Bubalus bubalis TaxID=89462 RepID=UPI001E1B8E33|nr:uncharacterized protein LOC123465983 [Bubalus bubalis]
MEKNIVAASSLPSHWSTQQPKLNAVIQALQLSKVSLNTKIEETFAAEPALFLLVFTLTWLAHTLGATFWQTPPPTTTLLSLTPEILVGPTLGASRFPRRLRPRCVPACAPGYPVFEHGRFSPDDIMGASECRLRKGDGEGEGGGEGKGWEAVPEPLPAARRPSASPGGALRRLLTKDGRMPAPRDERCAQPGGRLSSFALRRNL